jgi:hypothetical protein
MNISKELLREVLKIPTVSAVGTIDYWNCLIFYSTPCINIRDEHSINIYELAHKCKEWAFKNEYELNSGYLTHGILYPSKPSHQIRCDVSYKLADTLQTYRVWENTEPEAIFKACQWILDNKEIK